MKRQYPRLRVLWPGILVVVRSAEHERQLAVSDAIAVAAFLLGLLASAAYPLWLMFASGGTSA